MILMLTAFERRDDRIVPQDDLLNERVIWKTAGTATFAGH